MNLSLLFISSLEELSSNFLKLFFIEIIVYSHNKPDTITINNSVFLGFTQEENKADNKIYLS